MANSFNNSSIQVGISPTTIYTCPAGTTAIIFRLTLTNTTSATDIYADITLVKVSPSSTRKLGNLLPIPAGSVLSYADTAIVLKEGDSVQITSSDATSMDAFASILEIT